MDVFGDFGILRYPQKKTKRKKAQKKRGGGGRYSGKTKVCSICGFKSLKMDFWAEEFLGGFFRGVEGGLLAGGNLTWANFIRLHICMHADCVLRSTYK